MARGFFMYVEKEAILPRKSKKTIRYTVHFSRFMSILASLFWNKDSVFL